MKIIHARVSGMPYHRRFSYSWWTSFANQTPLQLCKCRQEKIQVTSLFKSVVGIHWLVKSTFLRFGIYYFYCEVKDQQKLMAYYLGSFDQVRIHIHHIHFKPWLRSLSERGGSPIFSWKCPRFSRQCPRIRGENVVCFVFGPRKRILSEFLRSLQKGNSSSISSVSSANWQFQGG